jgi:hypothetical protein
MNEFREQVWKDVWLIQNRADLVSEATWILLRGAINQSYSAAAFRSAKTVSEPHLFEPLRLPFERKQIPQVVVIVRISRKTREPLEGR